ncbi:MAG: GatB/YqeY domain-containing protein [Gammaproteobacteria bacterium]|nr:GatB/YqeY domain-containing protein [Gammaproteobacteria bacterium]
MSETIINQVSDQVKTAMKARDKARLAALRLMMAEFKRVEVDERIELDDDRVLTILDKMNKQRKDSQKQFADAGRNDLADQEAFELAIIAEFMPEQLSSDEIAGLVKATIAEMGAGGMQDMGKVMGALKSKVQGRADMGQVSGLVKATLG